MENNENPRVRIAVIGDPQPSDMGVGITKALTFYGSYNDLLDDHLLERETQAFLITNGMSRWSINRIGRPRALSGEDRKHESETHQADVIVMDPGI